MNSLKKNFIYNVLYQILILILPLITVPYVSRVLGAEGIGTYSYTYAIVYYFMIVGLLGINNHGNRTIAKVRDEKKKLSSAFFEIYSIQLIMNAFMIILYLLYILLFNNDYKFIALIQVLYLFSNMFDINWFFFGLEKFKLTVTRSTLLKLLSLILIFIFVKGENDIWIYTLILSLSTLLSQLLLIPFLLKEVDITIPKFKNIIKHLKPCLIMFIPVISISLYKVMDKLMLGLMSNVKEVGYYEQAEKIVNIPLGIITALGTVMLPRISNLVAKNDKKQIMIYIEKSMKFMMFLAFPICFGLIAVSHKFVPIFMGIGFQKSAILMNLLAITIIWISFANVIRKQYLVPYEKDKIFIVSVLSGAVVNLIINAILIPYFNSVGAAIGTIAAEFTVMIIQVIMISNELTIKEYVKNSIYFLLSSIIMYFIIYTFNFLPMGDLLIVALQVIVGSLIYFLLNISYIDELINLRRIITRISMIFLRRMPRKTAHKILFRINMGRKLDLNDPITLNEKIHWLILNKYGKKEAKLSDKYRVKKIIEDKKIKDLNIPKTLFVLSENDNINIDILPDKFVLKCNHGSGHVFVCTNKEKFDLESKIKILKNDLKKDYSKNRLEYHYSFIKPVIIVEEYLHDKYYDVPVDYKFFCYKGFVHSVMVCSDRTGKNMHEFYDKNWKRLDYTEFKNTSDIEKPKNLSKMFNIASKLSEDYDFVRVDLYNINGKIYFSELTFTPAAGLSLTYTYEADKELGIYLKLKR